jgi:nitric oxide reductase NorE protein
MSVARRRPVHLPGEEGVWIFVSGDLLIFSLLMLTFLYYRHGAVAEYHQAQQLLARPIAVLNTFFLITGSLMAVRSVKAARRGDDHGAGRLLVGAAFTGLLFTAAKVFEYQHEIRLGADLGSSEFMTFYFVMTGLHLFHVLIATAILLYLWRRSRPSWTEKELSYLESGVTVWHAVDAIWMLLFALLYLLP